MTSPPDVQNVPDVWGLLEQARRAYVELNLASNPTGPDWHKWYEHIRTLDAALAQRERFVLVPKELPKSVLDAINSGTDPAMRHIYDHTSQADWAEYLRLLAAAPKPIQGSIERVETHGPYKATFVEPTEPFNAPSRSGSMSDPSYTGANPLTPADDLPPLPEPFMRLMSQPVYDAWATHMRAYALAARAERDALFETQRKTLESQRDELMRKCAERDAEIEKWKRHYNTLVEVKGVRLLAERAEAAEARVKELERQNGILLDSDPIAAFRSSERKLEAAEKRDAELEERLMVIEKQPTVGWLIPPKNSITLLESVVVAWRERAFEVSELIERPKCT